MFKVLRKMGAWIGYKCSHGPRSGSNFLNKRSVVKRKFLKKNYPLLLIQAWKSNVKCTIAARISFIIFEIF